ncbi:alpha/beta hydrolase [Carboxydothermus hydrogenoformans]|uniref:Hydrolase, alpha/beta fold family n=1 Tax=Carboxydothermus hydrogenoformans (strain ATCC BAA-161 / DSM 6008 / Z-2901) TaxID=246194 RepID=Q3ADP4_CARHZ|nr:alpha/beta hydrolase [Carboxydothermus hydrogenoformans]ABB14808.1 hydrolase, alpha/beta fold family [Carboxydothermus hydrogenoformans Z-2901]
MGSFNFLFKASDGQEIYCYRWVPDKEQKLRAIVYIAHGMAETAARYERFALALTKEGYLVFAHDHRGHGKTAKSIEEIGYLGPDGFNRMVQDMKELIDFVKNENRELPIILFGHSMGSFLAQRYISLYGESINGVILSGTSCDPGPIVNLGIFLAKKEVEKYGPKHRSVRLTKLSFGNYNKKFKPNRTEFDWLSRDAEEVDKYINDPYCGGVFTASFYYDFLRGLKETFRRENLAKIPKELPIFIFSGDMDPVGNMGRGVLKLIKTYEKLGLKNVAYKLYPGGRHEMLNEINREEVVGDIINWLNKLF